MKLNILIVYIILLHSLIIVSLSEHTDSSDEEDDYEDVEDNECAADDTECNKINDNNDCDDCDIIDRLTQIYEEGVNKTWSHEVKSFNETVYTFDRLQNVAKSLLSPYKSTVAKAVELLSTADLSDSCFTAIVSAYNAIQNNQFWPMKFIDASGGLPKGLTEHVFTSFGDYDQCLDIDVPQTKDQKIPISGKYCMMELKIPVPPLDSYKAGDPAGESYDLLIKYLKVYDLDHLAYIPKIIEGLHMSNGTVFRVGVCMPSACSGKEIENAINKAFYPITRIMVDFGQKCEVKNSGIMINNYQLYSAFILISLLFLVILSTIIDMSLKCMKQCYNYSSENLSDGDETLHSKILLSFSLIRNTKSLFKSTVRFETLDTIKLLIIINAFFAHTYLFTPFLVPIAFRRVFTSTSATLLYSGRYFFVRNPTILDALFSMSGFILSYGLLGKLEKAGGRFSFIHYAILRWLRFAVPVFVSMLFFFLLPLSGDGPLWEYGMSYFTKGCESKLNLWSSLLLVNNFVYMLDIMRGVACTCNPPSWFLSALFQLHLIAPFMIILYYKRPKLALCVNVTVIAFGLFLSAAPQLLYGIKPYTQHEHVERFTDVNRGFKWYHTTTNMWVSSFFVGIMFGYAVRKEVKVSKAVTQLLWIAAILMIIVVYLWNNTLYRLKPTVSDVNALLWFTFGKLFAAIAYCWIFFACCTGRGGVFNKIFSWSGFRPLSNLSFSFFIMHAFIIIRRMFVVRDSYVMNDSYMFQNIIIDIMISFGLAYIFYIIFECPFNNIISILTQPKAKQLSPPVEGNLKNNIILQKHMQIITN